MNRNPVLVISEYLLRSEPQVRKNSLTALAMMQDEESLALLVRTALTDPDPGVRAHAEEELAQLTGADAVVGMLHRELASPEVDRRQAAYGLLGRLRLRGVPAARPRIPLPRRWRLAASLRSRAGGFWARLLDGRVLKVGLQAGGLGAILIALFLWASLDVSLRNGMFAQLLLIGPLLATAAALVVTRRSIPFGLQYDRLVAALGEICWVWFLSLVLALLGILVWSRFTGANLSAELYVSMAILALAFPLFAVAIRVGTLLALGMTRKTSYNFLLAVAAGAGAGLLTLTLPLALASVPEETAGGLAPFLHGAWLLLLPSAFGLAAAFAHIDQRNPTRSPVAGRAGAVLASILAGLLLLIPTASAVNTYLTQGEAARDSAQPLQPGGRFEHRTIDYPQLPAIQRFEIKREQPVLTAARRMESMAEGAELKLALLTYGSPRKEPAPVSKPAVRPAALKSGDAGQRSTANCFSAVRRRRTYDNTFFQEKLQPGCYAIELRQVPAPLVLGDVFPTLRRGGAGRAAGARLMLAFNPELRPNSCKTARNGQCDEGNGCDPGTDRTDCMRDSCRFAKDGECDETKGYCPVGTDNTDCGTRPPPAPGADSCEYARDKECDEPDRCSVGTDTTDCLLFPSKGPQEVPAGPDSCQWANDGECDEASRLCSPGTDTTDCRRFPPRPPGPDSCSYAKDGTCDEPELCARGTDTTDCR
jgi:hypothetical protein